MIGYVALLDVLGFKSIIAGDRLDEKLQEYLQALEDVTKTSAQDAAVKYVVFSDSIVLTSGDSIDSFKSLLSVCSQLFCMMLEKEFPLRGAVTYGTYLLEPNSNGTFVAGRAVVDAYGFETAQDWVGVMVAPQAIRQIPDLKEQCRIVDGHSGRQTINEQQFPLCTVLQPYSQIPFHRIDSFEPNNYNGFAIVPTDGSSEPARVRDSLSRSYEKLKWLEHLAPDPQTQRKFQNTSAWIYNLLGTWQDIAHSKERMEEQKR